jgi:leader peptidase (prepilin peptidase) / N-methyltransferase
MAASRPTYTSTVSPIIIVEVLAAIFGLLFGSFLNVCIARLPLGESIVSPRSKCLGCSTQIRWYDNIPLLSFVRLRAKCRDCKEPISWRYPAVELATALWFAACLLPIAHGLNLSFDPLLQLIVQQLSLCALGWLLIGLAVIDWKHHLLPDALTFTGIATGLFFACTEAIFLTSGQADVVLKHNININSANAGRSPGNIFLTGPEHLIFGRLLAAAAAFLLLYLIRVLYKAIRKRDGMGLGDAKLLAMIAAFLGFAPTAIALFAGVLLATLYAVTLLVRGKGNAATRLPFGSFLATGGLIAALWGQRIADWYLALFPS